MKTADTTSIHQISISVATFVPTVSINVTMSNPLKPIVSNNRILFGLLPGLGAMIVIRMAIHIYRPDIEDADHRVRDHPFEKLYNCYDFIIVGGGSAGSVLASRLSENPEWSVLLLEAGSDENVLSEVPVLFPILQTSSIDWQFVTEPSDEYCLSMVGKQCKWPRGKVLGGSSVLNAMLYIRGNKRDYNNWADMGNVGWSYQDVLPYFLKSEDTRIPEYQNDPYHGTGGPLTVDYFRFEHPITRKILEAGQQLGYKVLDVNGDYQTGFTRSHATVREGLRCSTAKAFLRPVSKRPNLHVSVHSLVEKVLIDEHKQAYGVKFTKNGHKRIIKARREVILSAGAIQSPQLLMLSGIGDAEHLKEHAIYPVVHLPGVGKNLQDHVAMGGHSFLFENPYDNGTDYCFNLRNVFSLGTLIDFAVHKTGSFYSMMEAEAMAFINTKYQDPAEDYPDIQLFIAPTADNMDGGLFGKRANGLTDETYAELYEDILYESSFSIVPLLLRPKSRGYLELRDANPYSPPRIYPNYYTHPDDLQVLIEGARVVQSIVEQPALKEIKARPNPYRNPGCEKHALMSEEHLACQARHHSLTIYHPVGTCAMGPATDTAAVVDPRLRVYGLKNLRVVDGSVMPTIVSGNTNAPVIMIAEKASDMIKEDWADVSEDQTLKCDSVNYRQDKNSEDADEPTQITLTPQPMSDVFNETNNLFPNLGMKNMYKTPLIPDRTPRKNTEAAREEEAKAKYYATQDNNDNSKPYTPQNDIPITTHAPITTKSYKVENQVYPIYYVPNFVPQTYSYNWPLNTLSNPLGMPSIPNYGLDRYYNRNPKPSIFDLKSKLGHVNKKINKLFNKKPITYNPLTYNYVLNGQNYFKNDDKPVYYETDEVVTSKGEKKCHIWLYYDGNKYEVVL